MAEGEGRGRRDPAHGRDGHRLDSAVNDLMSVHVGGIDWTAPSRDFTSVLPGPFLLGHARNRDRAYSVRSERAVSLMSCAF